MSSQISNLHKLPVTVTTRIWFFSRMQPHVGLQMVVSGEALMALGAFKRLLASMRPLMVLQHVFIPKRAIANFAGEYFVFGWVFWRGCARFHRGV
jgi:hypothetical protein